MNNLQKSTTPYKHYLLLAIACFVVWLPLVNFGQPYFYDEDEAHHFNRQVEMLQSGDLNPKYFLKPSLNFYLRLPALYGGYLLEKNRGHLNSLQDIITKDKFGISGYAFSNCYSGLIQANRLFSILIGILIVWGIYYLSWLLTKNKTAALLASLLYLASPLVFQHVTSIGVNQPAALFTLFSVIFATHCLQKFKPSFLTLSAIAAGLAISCKYNAAPIAIAPLVAIYSSRESLNILLQRLIVTVIIICASFLMGSPYLLIELPLAIQHISYEIWHYSTAGHIGHQAQPGLEQLAHYLKSLVFEGYGVLALAIASLSLISKKLKILSPTLLFIFSFAVLMISQKANFLRNLLLIMPFLPVLFAVGLHKIKSEPILLVVGLLTLIQPTWINYQQWNGQPTTDTRNLAYLDLHKTKFQARTAFDGNLWLPKFTKLVNGKRILSRQNISRLDFNKFTLTHLYLLGFEQVLMESKKLYTDPLQDKVEIIKTYSGNLTYPGRVIINPDLVLVKYKAKEMLKIAPDIAKNTIYFNLNKSGECKPVLTKDTWLEQKITKVNLSGCTTNDKKIKLYFNYLNYWHNQSLEIIQSDQSTITRQLKNNLNNFQLNIDSGSSEIYFVLNKLISPKEQGGADSRSLGIQIKK